MHTIVGTVRVVAPEEEMCEATVSVSIQIDRFFWHLHDCLSPLARDSDFFASKCDVFEDAHKTTTGSRMMTLFGNMSQLSQQWKNNMLGILSVMEAQVGFEGALLFADKDTPVQALDDELQVALSKAVDDKPVLQEAMKALHTECCAVKVKYSKSNVAWVKIAVGLPNRGKNRRPPVRRQRRLYPNM